MSRTSAASAFTLVLLACTIPQGVMAAMTISSDAPGCVFATKAAPVFSITAAGGGEVAYKVTSYWDQVMQTGTVTPDQGAARVTLKPLPPGFYQLDVSRGEESTSTGFGVVIDGGGAPLDPAGRVCVDSAAGWLCGPDQWRPLASIVRTAGIPWVRERLSWGEVERERGKLDWGRYDTVADAYKAEGVHVYQIFHDSPGWSLEKRPGTRNPEDLRDAYAFAKAASAHFAGRIEAWEVWNEPDIGFWPDLGDRFAGVQKACYLGLKAGNPAVSVLQGSWCRGVCAFDDNLEEQGLPSYWDIFNWHIYAAPDSYPPALASYLDVLRRYKAADRPIWLSEAGIHLMGKEGPGKSLLTPDDQHTQCRFVAPSVIMSLIAGTDRHFFFVLPNYLENGVQFGLLKPDLTPYPGFLALSACANLIGRGEYVGQLATDDKSVQGRLFATPKGNVMVLWAPQPTVVALLCAAEQVMVADVFGYGEATQPVDGKLTLKIGPEATYVVGIDDGIRERLTGRPVRKAGVLPRNAPSPVIIVGHADLPADKAANTYNVKASQPFDYTVDVYNFGHKTVTGGQISLRLPAGWTADKTSKSVSLQAAGRERFVFRCNVEKPTMAPQKLIAEGRFPGMTVGRAVSSFTVDLASLPPTAELPLDLTAASWHPSISGNGAADSQAGANGEYVLSARFDKPGDRWCYSTYQFPKPADFSAFNAVSFEVRCDNDDTDSRIRFMVGEPNGARYFTGDGAKPTKQWQRSVFAFRDMGWGAFSPPDPNGKLDLNAISHIEIGFNTPCDTMRMEVRNLKLVKLGD